MRRLAALFGPKKSAPEPKRDVELIKGVSPNFEIKRTRLLEELKVIESAVEREQLKIASASKPTEEAYLLLLKQIREVESEIKPATANVYHTSELLEESTKERDRIADNVSENGKISELYEALKDWEAKLIVAEKDREDNTFAPSDLTPSEIRGNINYCRTEINKIEASSREYLNRTSVPHDGPGRQYVQGRQGSLPTEGDRLAIAETEIKAFTPKHKEAVRVLGSLQEKKKALMDRKKVLEIPLRKSKDEMIFYDNVTQKAKAFQIELGKLTGREPDYRDKLSSVTSKIHDWNHDLETSQNKAEASAAAAPAATSVHAAATSPAAPPPTGSASTTGAAPASDAPVDESKRRGPAGP